MQTSVASKIPLSDFCHFCEKLSSCHKTKKAECLQRFITYFRNYAKSLQESGVGVGVDDSFYPILRLLLPQLERERGAYGVKEHTLAKIYIRILGLPKHGHDADKLLNFKAPHAAGMQSADFADVAFFVLRSRCRQGASQLTVEQVNWHLDNIAAKHAAHDPRGMDDELTAMFIVMSASCQKWLIRMLLKDMRLGLGSKKILSTFHPDAQDLYDVSNDLKKVCQLLKDPSRRLHEVDVCVFSPFRPMLAERCNVRQVEDSMKKGRVYYVETKHDGERFQLHMQDGIYKYFSRRGFDSSDTFGSSPLVGLLTPHIVRLLRRDVHSIILDGEMMGWNTKLKCYKTKGNCRFAMTESAAQKSRENEVDVKCRGDSEKIDLTNCALVDEHTAMCDVGQEHLEEYCEEAMPPSEYMYAEEEQDMLYVHAEDGYHCEVGVYPEQGSMEEYLDNGNVPVFTLVPAEGTSQLVTHLYYVSYEELLEDLFPSQ